MDSKTRAKLRACANKIQATVMLGKEGLTENVLGQIEMDLTAHELVKIAVMQNCDIEPKDTINELAKVMMADPVGVIGRKMIIYRYSSKCKNHILEK